MPTTKIAPSVLAADMGNLNAECKRVMDMGADWLHMDVMDGHFVPNIVLGAPILASVYKAVPDIFMDCHMMVSDPARWVKDIAAAGGKSYTFHLEATDDPMDVVRQIKATGMRAAVAINPGTPSSEISNELGNAVDMILVMTVWPGAGGQKFIAECMPKVAELRARFPDLDVEVDGGVGPKTITKCADAGANVIVAGTAIFHAESPRDVIHFLRTKCDDAQVRIKAERDKAQAAMRQNGSAAGYNSAETQKAKDAMQNGGSITPMSQPKTYFAAGLTAGSEPPPAASRNATTTAKT